MSETDAEGLDPTHREIPTDASNLIRDNLTEYGENILQYHFPQFTDGLKALYKRILWLARDWASTGLGSSSATGKVKELHDHSPEAIYEAIARLSQDFNYRPGLIEFHGSNGSYEDRKPSAERYTSVTISDFGKEVLFKGIEVSAIPMQLSSDLKGYEPQYLIPAIPLSLTLGNLSIGYGYSSKLLPRNLGDICDLVSAYCKHIEKHGMLRRFDARPHAEKLLPDFPILNTITNYRKLLSEYKQGNFDAMVEMEGHATLMHDAIIVHTLPMMTTFDVVERIRLEIDKKGGSWCERNIIDARQDPDGVFIQLKRNTTTTFEAWERVRRIIGFTGTFHPNPNYCNADGHIHQMSPEIVMEAWYRKRHDLLLASKRRQLNRMVEQRRILEAHLVVCKHRDEVLKILRGSSTTSEAVTLLTQNFELTVYQAEHLTKAQLHILIKSSAEDLMRQHAELSGRIEVLQESLQHISQEISATAQEIKRKYATPRVTKLPRYVGYMAIGGGCIQFEQVSEIQEIMTNFPRGEVAVHMYDGPNLIQVDQNGKFVKGNIPRYTTGDIYGLSFDGASGYTVNISEDGTACCVRGIVPGLRSAGFFYTTKMSKAIHRNGVIETIDVPKTISVRKTVCRGAATDIIYVYPDTSKTHYVLVMNDTEPNILTLQCVTDTSERIVTSPVGNVTVVHSYSGNDWYFTVPQECLNRISSRVFHIIDAEALMDGKKQLRIDLAAAKWKRHALLKQLS